MKLRLIYKHKIIVFALMLSAIVMGLLGVFQKETRIIGTITSSLVSFRTSSELVNLFSLDHIQSINQVIIRNYDKIVSIV